MLSAYPIILTPSEGGYVVFIPDLNINTQGDSIGDAMFMARDAIGVWSCSMLANKRPIPKPNTVTPQKETPDDIITLVDIDIDEYRKKHDDRTVRRNITLPCWLDQEAKRSNVNVSRIAQNALKEYLNLPD